MRRTVYLFFGLTLWWVAVSLVYTEQTINMSRQAGKPYTWSEVLPFHLAGYLLWVPICFFLLELVQRFPFEREKWVRATLVMCGGVAAAVLIRGLFVYLLNPITGWWYEDSPAFSQVIRDSVRNNLILAWMIVGVSYAVYYFDKAQAGRARIAELEVRVANARMEVLTAQLRPHFLFNTLNSIAEMVHHDADRADRMVVGLSALLRNSIESESRQKIALQDELVLLLHYVEIEQVRLGGRLQFTSDIGPGSGQRLVPAFLLQPLVENCIVHGISKSEAGGAVVVRANVAGECLCIEIDDTGGGQVIVGAHRGVGLANTESRLQAMYGDRYEFSVQPNDHGGTRVSIRVPASI
jgi:hypothetical protein